MSLNRPERISVAPFASSVRPLQKSRETFEIEETPRRGKYTHEVEEVDPFTRFDLEAERRLENVLRKERSYNLKKEKPFSLPPRNRKIPLETIDYIDLAGKYHESVSLSSVLSTYSIQEHVLVLVDEVNGICRLFTIDEFMKQVERIVSQKKEGIDRKELQLTWNIGDNDLMYRLNRIVKYLQRGCRVDIIIGAKKIQLVRNLEARSDMLTKIRETLAPYGYEWRELTGGFPSCELWFQGGKPHPEQDKGEGEEVEESVVDKKILGGDQTVLTREEVRAGRSSLRNRKGKRHEADKAFKEATGNMKSETFWENLAVLSTEATTQTTGTATPDNVAPTTVVKSPRTRPTQTAEDAEARRKEVNQNVDSEKQAEIEAKLRSVATQFSKLASARSMFGGKLGGR